MSQQEIRVFIVDDHPVVLEGLASGLKNYPQIKIVGTALNADEAMKMIEQVEFDLLITDLYLSETRTGLDVLRHAAAIQPECKIFVLSYSSKPEDVLEANHAGAHAYMVKDCDLDDIALAMTTIYKGGRPALSPEMEAVLWSKLQETAPDNLPGGLTERECEVLRLMTEGSTNKEIARKLFISARVVRRANTAIYEKLSVRNRTEAVAKAMQEGWFQ